MSEPMLALAERDPERPLAIYNRYLTSPDPWVRAAMPMMRGSFGRMLGCMPLSERGHSPVSPPPALTASVGSRL